MPRRRYAGIESKDFVGRTGPSSEKRARLLEKLQAMVGRARFLAVREQIQTESDEDESSDEFASMAVARAAKDAESDEEDSDLGAA